MVWSINSGVLLSSILSEGLLCTAISMDAKKIVP